MPIHDYDNEEYDLESNIRMTVHREMSLSGKKASRGESIILLHGLGAHSGTWRKNAPYFSELGYQVIAPTISSDSSQIVTPERIKIYGEQISQLINLIPMLGKDKKLSLVGNSMGGWIAMNFAVRNPRIVRSLVLEDSAGVKEEGSPESNLIDCLNRSEIPILIVWGDQDRIIPVDNGRLFHSRVKKSLLVIFDETGHVPHWEKPDKFNDTVANFLSSL